MKYGLYDPASEHDACGVGMVVNIRGDKTLELVDNALTVLENMSHRGAEGADGKSGDGACSTAVALEWDAAFKGMNDPSGRAVSGVHEHAL